MDIRYEKKSVYGQNLLVIVDEDKEVKEALHTMTARKCVNENDLEALRALGHRTIEVVHAGSKIVEVV